jgi:hypothetical protein
MILAFRSTDNRPDRSVARINTEHIVTKERGPAPTRNSGTYASFTCTCGWKARTASGIKNWLAEAHARQVRAAGPK